MGVIEVHGLHKEYRRLRGGRSVAVADLDLDVPEGGVFGFLGPNGSGKTTTIRCLLGLARPTKGRCRVLGVDSQTDLRRVLERVGSIVETPALFPTFSARRNLDHLAGIYRLGPARVDAVLETAGLTDRQRDSVKSYSLGMRQRLGIAAALLKDPELLILDEPANGLDPGGIKEVRELLRRLGAEGRTVFVSSHLLTEIRQTCDRVAILARGRCVAAGDVEDVLTSGGAAGVLVKIDDLSAGTKALEEAGMKVSAAGDALRVEMPPADAARVSKALAAKGLYPTELRPDEADLETVFLELTGDVAGPAPDPSAGP